jgi:MFS family permease
MKGNAVNRARAMQFLYYAAFGSAINYFTLYYKELIVSPSGEPMYEVIGTIMLVQSMAAFTAPLIAGYLADKYQITNRLITICSFGVALGITLVLIPGLSPFAGLSLTGKLMLIFPGAITATFFIKPLVPLIDTGTLKALEERDGHADHYGQVRLAGSIGWILCCILVGRWLDRTGRLVDSLIIYVVAFAILGLVASRGFNTTVKKVDLSWKYLLSDKILRTIITIGVVRMFGFSMAFTYTGVFLSEMNMTYAQMGLAFGLAAILEIPFFFNSGWLIRKMGGKNLMVIGMTIQIIRLALFFLFPNVGNAYFYVAVQTLMGLGFCLYLTGYIHILHRIAPKDLKASYQNIFYVFTAFAGIFSGFTASFIVKYWGINTLMGICCAILLLALAYMVLKLKIPKVLPPA